MCTGAILLFKIPRVVIGENVNFMGNEDYLRARGVDVVVLDDQECKDMMAKYIKENPKVIDPVIEYLAALKPMFPCRNGTRISANHDDTVVNLFECQEINEANTHIFHEA